MTSNDVIASNRSSARWGRSLRVLIGALPLALVVLAIAAVPVFAQTTSTTTTSSTETGYSQKPEKPTEEGYKQKPQKPESKKAVAPEKEEVAPKKEEVAPKQEVAPEAVEQAAPAKASELPFTGLDLRWVLGVGVALLLAGGLSLKLIARRERRGHGR